MSSCYREFWLFLYFLYVFYFFDLLQWLGPPVKYEQRGGSFTNVMAKCLASGKESACQCRRHKSRGFDPWVRKILWSRKWHSTSVFLTWKFHGQESLVGYGPWDCKESDMTEWLSTLCFYIMYKIICGFYINELCQVEEISFYV